ncbi:MAG: 2Fe-2S iron-sulfur cluster-binding protein [Pseudomonadales bacterium]
MTDFLPLTVSHVHREPNDMLQVTFDVPAASRERFRFTQGQYLTLRATIDGTEVRRSYSICAGVDEPLAIAIKQVDGGMFSNWAHTNLRPGVTVETQPPTGDFQVAIDPASTRSYLCIAAGSGITPILSVMRTVLAREPHSQVTLLYGNRRSADIAFREALCWLKNAYLTRFQWINVFTREPQAAEILNGRIDNRKGGQLNRQLIDIRGYDEFFLCGPEGMISEVSRGLRGQGIVEDHIHYELFFASAEDARRAIERHHERARKHAGLTTDVRVRAGGREIALELTADGQNILDGALAAGLDLPYSCKGGICATCKARLLEGDVEMDVNRALSERQLDAGYILTCQAHPVSSRVVVDFDVI